MKKYFTVTLLLVLVIFSTVVRAVEFPLPQGYVNDFAEILSPDTKTLLESRLNGLEKENGIEIAVITVVTLENIPIEEYAVELFEKWQIGKRGQDNGLLLLIALDEQEVRIETGYGLEEVVTDAKAGNIIRNKIIPEFKAERYDMGVVTAINELIYLLTGGEIKPDNSAPDSQVFPEINSWLLFLMPVMFLYLVAFLARSKEWWPGGLLGVVLGGLLGWLMIKTILASFLGSILLGVIGLIFDLVLSSNYQQRTKSKLPTTWWKSGGGFFGGGSGGSTGGSSFGGFGGGRSGGGGASGKW